MKNLIFMFVMLYATALTAQTVDEAIEWNDDIVLTQSVLLSYEDDLISAIAEDKSTDSIAVAYFNYLTFINVAIDYYADEDPFDTKDTFRKAIIKLLSEFKEIAANEYAELIYIYLKPADDLSDSDFERWDILIAEIDKVEGESNDDFLEAQKQFAAQYGFSLGD